jgi:hypothetical protein
MTIIVSTPTVTGQLSSLLSDLQQRGYASDTAAAQIILLNSSYRRVCAYRRWPWLESQTASIATVNGTSAYNLSTIADFLFLDAVRSEQGTNYYELEYKDPQTFRTLQHNYRDRSTPEYWTREGEQIKIWPTPDGIYTLTIDYIKRPTDLANDTDVPLIPVNYRDILIWGAIMELTFRERDTYTYQLAEQQYQGRLNEMMAEYGLSQRQTASEVGRSDYYASQRNYLIDGLL